MPRLRGILLQLSSGEQPPNRYRNSSITSNSQRANRTGPRPTDPSPAPADGPDISPDPQAQRFPSNSDHALRLREKPPGLEK